MEKAFLFSLGYLWQINIYCQVESSLKTGIVTNFTMCVSWNCFYFTIVVWTFLDKFLITFKFLLFWNMSRKIFRGRSLESTSYWIKFRHSYVNQSTIVNVQSCILRMRLKCRSFQEYSLLRSVKFSHLILSQESDEFDPERSLFSNKKFWWSWTLTGQLL